MSRNNTAPKPRWASTFARIERAHALAPRNIPLIFVMGVTNVGKSTIMDAARVFAGGAFSPSQHRYTKTGLVEVGKMFRAKYPPEHFNGQGAPAHTQTEAWQMMTDGIAHCVEQRCTVAFIDGQPRNWEQMQWAVAMSNPKLFLHLWAPHPVRVARAQNRDAKDPGRLALTAQRLVDDVPKLYDIVTYLQVTGQHVTTVDTTAMTHSAERTVLNAIQQLDR